MTAGPALLRAGCARQPPGVRRYGGAPWTARSTASPLTCSERAPTASSAPSATARECPDTRTPGSLREKAQLAQSRNCAELNFYAYGLYRLQALDQIRPALFPRGAKSPAG